MQRINKIGIDQDWLAIDQKRCFVATIRGSTKTLSWLQFDCYSSPAQTEGASEEDFSNSDVKRSGLPSLTYCNIVFPVSQP